MQIYFILKKNNKKTKQKQNKFMADLRNICTYK